MGSEVRFAVRITEACPRCDGQRHDRGSCALCGNLGWLCPECGGRMTRTAIYVQGFPLYRCTECGLRATDESEEPVSPGKLVPLAVTPQPVVEEDSRVAEDLGIRVTLTCTECGATANPKPILRLTKLGTLRLHAFTDFYVDGAGARCSNHRPDPMPSPQNETWTEYDRRAVMVDLYEEGVLR